MRFRYALDLLSLLLAALLLSACGSTRPGMRKFGAVRVPPGVEPIVAVRADSLSRQLFVPRKDELKAQALVEEAQRHYDRSDSLWQVLDRAAAEAESASPEDSAAAMSQTVSAFRQIQKAMPLAQEYKKKPSRELKIKATYHLQEAEKALVKALKLNPLSNDARRLLALTYKLLGDRFLDKQNYDRAIEIWGTLIRLEPGEYINYYHLGENYYARERWRDALANFERSEETLLASAEVSPEVIANPSLSTPAAIDSTVLFLSVYYQAQSAIQIGDESKALSSLNRAWQLATIPSNRAAVESYLAWIKWDDGNIETANMRDSANVLAARGDMVGAAEKYKQMLPKMRSERAKNEVASKLALIEYTNLNQKPVAVERMLSVVKRIQVDSTTGAPLDSSAQQYFDIYGTMCHNLGIDNTEVDRQKAYTYFMQASKVHWKARGKSYLAMAKLAAANPKQAIADAEKALALKTQLESQEVVELYKLLVNGYRRIREFAKARYYLEELRRIQQGASNGSSAQ